MKKILIILIALLLCGCKTIRYVPVETVKTDSLYINKVTRDTTIVRDSVYLRDYGDTIYMYKYKYIYKDRIVADTSYIERTDTISTPYPVEKELNRWEKIKMQTGGYTLAAGLLLVLYLIIRFVKKRVM